MKYDQLYINLCHEIACQSHDAEVKVGSLIEKDGTIISMGWNGMPTGMRNETRSYTGATNPEVLHAEANALTKLAKAGGGSDGATLYCTHSPCFECAKLILQAGIKRVVYTHDYDTKAILFLKERGIGLGSIKYSDRISGLEGRPDQSKQPESKQRRSAA